MDSEKTLITEDFDFALQLKVKVKMRAAKRTEKGRKQKSPARKRKENLTIRRKGTVMYANPYQITPVLQTQKQTRSFPELISFNDVQVIPSKLSCGLH